MKSFDKDMEKLKKEFQAAYHEKEKTKIGDEWQMSVMNRIRRIGPLPAGTDYFALFSQTVWRFAPVAGILILVLAVSLIKLDFIPGNELVRIFFENPMEFTLEQIFTV
jgi:hypothetical protein